ncbi:MAG TPA: histidinol dehydrogenase [Syntrophorhabdaceae bacterium]|nr:histidinol dehydrogenase [Syntrophorhabdaceae bacterium]HPU30645.1 histidinol dehydrogenase [Syntrophorhabdaceae bacterium]
MKVWELEKEREGLLDFILKTRQKTRVDVRHTVATIRDEIIAKGDEAIKGLSYKYDNWDKDYPLKILPEEIEEAARKIAKKDISVLKGMIKNVRLFHLNQGAKKRIYKKRGLSVVEDYVPVEKALIYVPGGRAAYPSSLIMAAVPAQIAGVKHIYVTTPTPYGLLNPYVAAALLLLGIQDVYRIGGAQAIYAFSLGIGTIPKVDIVVGPGNAFVDEAKRDVYGFVGIDMLAGPSELIILNTKEASPEFIARDLFSQAEHDDMATVGLFSNSKTMIKNVMKEMERLMVINERKDIIERAIKANSFFVYFKDIEKAIDFINTIAPEHMEFIGDEGLADKVLYPGIIYIGEMTPVAIGDYYIGTNHILPTGGAGRFTAGLSVDTFRRRRVKVKTDNLFFERFGEKAERLARIEGLFAHAEAIKARKGVKR